MKAGNIIILSIFLIAIFMIGCASAAQNDTLSDDIIQNGNDEINIIEKSEENTTISQNAESNDILEAGSEKLNLDANIQSDYLVDSETTIYIKTPHVATSKISIYIDNKKVDSKIKNDDETPYLEINFEKLGLKAGLHNITFEHSGDSRFAPMSKTYSFNLTYFIVYIPTTNWGDESGLLASISPSAKGTLSVYADKKLFMKDAIKYLYTDENEEIRLDSLSYGMHEIEVRYVGPEGTFSQFGKFSNDAFCLALEEKYPIEWGISELTVWMPKKVSKQPTVTINGRTYKFTIDSSYYGTTKISKNAFKIGKNTVVFRYPGDAKYPAMEKIMTIEVRPQILYPTYIGSKEAIILNMPTNTKGTYTLYELIGDDIHDLKYKKLSSGNAKNMIYLPKMSSGTHWLQFEFKDSTGQTYKEEFTVNVAKNTNGFKSSVKPKTIKYGHEVTIKIKFPKFKGMVFVSLDNVEKKYVSLKNGKATVKLQILKSGKHKISVYTDIDRKPYSKAFYITVKKPTSFIKLNAVKVKRSAKKLVLTATVKKADKTPLKGKKVTFKFNNKVYKAKTNKKGIAKVIIKKSILKKLKAGKKVRYEAKYQYSVKKVAKVKK